MINKASLFLVTSLCIHNNIPCEKEKIMWDKYSYKNPNPIKIQQLVLKTNSIVFQKNTKLLFDDYTLRLKKGINFYPYKDESGELICIINEELGIDVYASIDKFDELEEVLYNQIDFLWKDYALDDDINLGNDAIELKNNLHRYFQEV